MFYIVCSLHPWIHPSIYPFHPCDLPLGCHGLIVQRLYGGTDNSDSCARLNHVTIGAGNLLPEVVHVNKVMAEQVKLTRFFSSKKRTDCDLPQKRRKQNVSLHPNNDSLQPTKRRKIGVSLLLR